MAKRTYPMRTKARTGTITIEELPTKVLVALELSAYGERSTTMEGTIRLPRRKNPPPPRALSRTADYVAPRPPAPPPTVRRGRPRGRGR